VYLNLDTEDFITVSECLNGNGRAYEKIVEKYQKVIFRLAGKFVKDFDDAEEITQCVFVKAYENLNKYDPKYKFFSWLYRIAVNETINFEKRKKNKETINASIRSNEHEPDRIFDNNALSDHITEALMDLDMLYRLPVVLKHFLDYSYKELSYLLGVPEKTVKSRLFTGRQLLKDILIKKRVTQNG
jgi:RNA polymerase sigma-70 factor, ECF subfamily